jgi:predicted alpha/beta-fold hydrolase
MINARNDPFLPDAALPEAHELSPCVAAEFPATGGHVGFVSGALPRTLAWLPRRILDFFGAHDIRTSSQTHP